MEFYVSLASLITGLVISVLSLGLVYRQSRDSTKATKSQLAVSLIDQLYSDILVQNMLELILTNNVFFRTSNRTAIITCIEDSKEKNIYLEMNIMLNRFQVLGLSYHLGVFNEEDLRGIKFEVIKVGRSDAIRSYFHFLNTEYQEVSCVEHDHFDLLKKLYLALETDFEEATKFKDQCLLRPRSENSTITEASAVNESVKVSSGEHQLASKSPGLGPASGGESS